MKARLAESGGVNLSEIEIVRGKVARYFKEIFPKAKQNEKSDWTVAFESTRVWATVENGVIPASEKNKSWHLKHDIPHVRVKLWSVILVKVPRSPGLFKWVATEGQNWMFGGTRVVLDEDGNCSLLFSYSIAGETMDPGEFKNAVMFVATTANHLDDIAQNKFGGKRFIDLKVEDLK